ncbi:hypothetical protein L5515_004446 [Caenorhabditis briggsae]|uniref:Major sperm protein n=1 Tax=Caenorhabditis briggsae TaxID=6238 RepID=A0AAE9JB49_CAEBR|nr:hypothetical protein L5515_004446 [Caenorhabditis briggsae]
MADHVALEDITNCPIHNIDEDNNVFSTTTTRPSRTEHRLRMLAKNFKDIRSSSMASSSSAAMRPFGTARLTPGRQTGRQQQTQQQQISTPEPMIAIALSDMEYLMRSARSSRSSGRSERQPGCTCCCHIAAGVTVIPRVARFSVEGGLSTHTLMNHSDNRIAVKITCSDNNMYRVTPVYATVEPGQSLPLHIARITSDLIKRDRLCVNILEADGNKEAREIFKKNANTRAPASINMALEATNDGQNHHHHHHHHE